MEHDPATQEFLRLLKEDNNVKGTESRVWDGSRAAPVKKTTFKGNYGGGNEYHQMDPDLEYQNLTKEVLGSDLSGLDERPGSMMVNDEDEPGETTELELDTGDGAATRKGRPFAAPEGFTKITDGLPVHKDAPGKTKPGKELGEDVEGCCGHPRGHFPIGCDEMAAFKSKQGYVPCLQDHMAGDICCRALGHEGGCDGDTCDEAPREYEGCESCDGEGCEACFDAPISGEDTGGMEAPRGSNGPQNGIAHESRYSALPDDVVAEALGEGPQGEGEMFPHAMKESPLSPFECPTAEADRQGGWPTTDAACVSCGEANALTCDICGEFCCERCEPEHNISAHSGGPYG